MANVTSGQRFVGGTQRRFQIDGCLVKPGIARAAFRMAVPEVNAIDTLEGKIAAVKPILRIIGGHVGAAVAEVQSRIGRAAAAARVGDQGNPFVSGRSRQGERAGVQARFTAQDQGVIGGEGLKLEDGAVPDLADQRTVGGQPIGGAGETSLIKCRAFSWVKLLCCRVNTADLRRYSQ